MTVNPYRFAIEQTATTIQRRAALFRDQVVVVAFLVCMSVAVAAAIRTWFPILSLGLCVPVVGLFLTLDARMINSWRSKLLADWSMRTLDLHTLLSALRAVPTLPPSTLEAMISSLPCECTTDLMCERKISAITRKAIAATIDRVYQDNAERVFARSLIALTLVGGLATARWSAMSYAATTCLIALLIARWVWVRNMCDRLYKVEMTRCRNDAEFAEEVFCTAVRPFGADIARIQFAMRKSQ